ncbi:MAG: peptidoglycan editing factor PgeF [Gammaproteobacteria bacterium]
MSELELVQPQWPAPASVHCVVTTRTGGHSGAPYDSLNLARHVGDSQTSVGKNRGLLQSRFPDIEYWQWLNQVHGQQVHRVQSVSDELTGDGVVTDSERIACCILTADCLPVLICNQDGTEVGAAHGGWRGLAAGILHNTVAAFESPPTELMAWLGPAIGPCHFEVGAEVREAFLNSDDSSAMQSQFEALGNNKFLANLYGIARQQLSIAGVDRVYGGNFCTHCDATRFFSYRRDGESGRMLSAIYLG